MWTVFKIINFFWLLAATYVWVTALIPQPLLLVFVNAIMILSLSFLPIKYHVDAKTGWILLAILALTLWSTWVDGWIMGIMTFMMYFPVLYLLQLPFDYKKDLLSSVTKWYSILLIPAVLLYLILLVVPLPSIGTFEFPNYMPYKNYIFYIKTTFELETVPRFNAFFLEPGHQSLVSSFIMMANRYNFRKCPWLFACMAGVLFSFSLAGYLLTAVGFALLKVNSVAKALLALAFVGAVVGGAMAWSGGDNALNELIIKRLEYDESSGIKGNNRFFDNTDFVYQRTLGTKYFWTGVKGKANMSLIGGAGFKIYILNYGMIGTILAMLFYLSVIPSKPDIRYTVSFFIVLALCFMQRAYPYWYSWMFPYVMGIYIAKGEKAKRQVELSE